MRFRHVLGACVLALAAVSCSLEVDPDDAGTINVFVDVSDSQLTVGQESITLTVIARNVGYGPLTLTGPSDCLLFVEVRDSQGSLVWDSTRSCQGSIVTEELAVNAEKVQAVTWDGTNHAGAGLAPGFYYIRAVARLTGGSWVSPTVTVALD